MAGARGSSCIKSCSRAIIAAADKEWELQRQLQHAETGPALLRPIAAYNDFAIRFSGAISAPERVFWKADLPFAEGVTLRIHGLNSTILSGWHTPEGKNDVERDLYVGPQQTSLDPVDNIINLVMCHQSSISAYRIEPHDDRSNSVERQMHRGRGRRGFRHFDNCERQD
jgi:hypothetical protein